MILFKKSHYLNDRYGERGMGGGEVHEEKIT